MLAVGGEEVQVAVDDPSRFAHVDAWSTVQNGGAGTLSALVPAPPSSPLHAARGGRATTIASSRTRASVSVALSTPAAAASRWTSSRPLLERDEPVPSPTDAQQPGLRRERRLGHSPCRKLVAVPIEPGRRRARIDARDRTQVLARVGKNVNQRIAHHARGRESARVIAIAPHGAASAEQAIDRTRDANGEASHAAREGACARCLDDQVNVIGLHGVVHHAEVRTSGLSDRLRDLVVQGPAAQRFHLAARAQSDEDGMPLVMPRTPAMRDARPPAGRSLPTGTGPVATPARSWLEAKGQLVKLCLDWTILSDR